MSKYDENYLPYYHFYWLFLAPFFIFMVGMLPYFFYLFKKVWDGFCKKMGVGYHTTICILFCILKKIKNGITITIFGLITMLLPSFFLQGFLKKYGRKS